MSILIQFFVAMITQATPTLLAGLGIVFSERAGIVNISVEGMMLVGALAGVCGSYLSGSALLGLLFAMFFSLLFAAIFGLLTVYARADQTIIGTGMNILAAGLTITINRAMFGASTSPPKIAVFEKLNIPGLSTIPYLGDAIFHFAILVYLAFLAVPLAQFVLYRSNLGLKLRSVGENPLAAETVGIAVRRTRFCAVLFSGAMGGAAGAFVSMGQLSFFTEGMIAGGGFIALAAVVFGNYTPYGVLLASLVFGASKAAMSQIQAMSTGIPSQLPLLIPYIITIVALCVMHQKSNKPAASGQPF